MSRAPTNLISQELSTLELPEIDRVPFWREFFVRKVLLADIQHLADTPLHAEVKLVAWPGMQTGWFDIPTTMRCSRTPAQAADGADGVSFFIKQTGVWTMSQRQRYVSLGDGDAVGALSCEPSDKSVSHLKFVRVFVPRAALEPLVDDLESLMLHAIPASNDALSLLRGYLSHLQTESSRMSPELRALSGKHIVDLVAMALGATQDGAATAATGGMRAARLHATKTDIIDNLADVELSIAEVAQRQRVTPRYIHLLFETEGVTFSEFVLRQRLSLAHQILTDKRCVSRTISSVAYSVGFGDLSYFNRTFRQRFKATPTDVRQRAIYERDPAAVSGLLDLQSTTGRSNATDPTESQLRDEARKPSPAPRRKK